MNKPFFLLLFALLLSAAACRHISPATEGQMPERIKLARVFDEYLYKDEVEDLVTARTSDKDSADIVGRYVDAWIRKQLLLAKAKANTALDQAEINRRMQEYRYQLIVYGYEKQFIENNLDTVVTQEEILEYYEKNQENFGLKKHIIKGLYLKVPKSAPQYKKVKKWLNSAKTKDREKLSSYAYRYADKFVLNDSVWMAFDDIIANTPFVAELENVVNTLKRRVLLETSDEKFRYHIKVSAYKISGNDVSPPEMVFGRIRSVILNKRKLELKKSHEHSIYEAATKENSYEIFE